MVIPLLANQDLEPMLYRLGQSISLCQLLCANHWYTLIDMRQAGTSAKVNLQIKASKI